MIEMSFVVNVYAHYRKALMKITESGQVLIVENKKMIHC